MSASQFEDNSISKLMAGAMLMDAGCDLPFWPSESFPGSSQSSQIVKMEKEGFAPNNIDCWSLPGQQPPVDFHQSGGFQHITQNNGFNPISNGSINGNNAFGQNFGSSHFKPPQDQFRKRYGNYSNEQYPDSNIALKAETDEGKWNNCTMNTHTDLFEPTRSGNGKNVSLKEGPYSPLSFKLRDRTSQKLSPNMDSERKLFDMVESDSDSKTSDSQPTTHPDWTGDSPSPDINVDQMINSGVTVAGYKPRKLICKRKKSTVPSDLKDPGYWEKRKKNNDSARRSREAKKEKERNFYKRALELEYENHYLKERVAFLERKLESVMKQNSSYPGPENQTAPPPPLTM